MDYMLRLRRNTGHIAIDGLMVLLALSVSSLAARADICICVRVALGGGTPGAILHLCANKPLW